MILVNNAILNVKKTDKDYDLASYAKEYQEGVSALRVRFPSGIIQLQQNGYPRINKSLDPEFPDMPEVAPPTYFKLTRTDPNGVIWGYCKGRPKIEANGLASVPEGDNWDVVDGEILSINLNEKPDYAFFIMYKSNLLKGVLHIHDPQGERLKELQEKNDNIKVQSLIWSDLEDNKLRTVAQAWGVSGVDKKEILVIKDELEKKILSMDADKKKHPENLMLRGVAEFISDTKTDEVTRPKAIVQMAFDSGKLKFRPTDSHMVFGELDLGFVPFDKQNDKATYIVNMLRLAENKEKWVQILKSLIDKGYIEGLDKHGLRWLATQFDIALNQKEESLRTALLELFVV
jgi:hypothetical protein